MAHSPNAAGESPWPGGATAGPRGSTAWPRRRRWRQNAPMKWWGWGDEDVTFTHEDKPDLGPFLAREIDVDVALTAARPVGFDELEVPEPALDAELHAALEAAVGPAHVSTDPLDRVVHARGKS